MSSTVPTKERWRAVHWSLRCRLLRFAIRRLPTGQAWQPMWSANCAHQGVSIPEVDDRELWRRIMDADHAVVAAGVLRRRIRKACRLAWRTTCSIRTRSARGWSVTLKTCGWNLPRAVPAWDGFHRCPYRSRSRQRLDLSVRLHMALLGARGSTRHQTSNPRSGPQPVRHGSEPTQEVGRPHGHQWAVFMATSGQFRGRLWALFHGRRHESAKTQ